MKCALCDKRAVCSTPDPKSKAMLNLCSACYRKLKEGLFEGVEELCP